MQEINFIFLIKANICLLESPRKAINSESCIVQAGYSDHLGQETTQTGMNPDGELPLSPSSTTHSQPNPIVQGLDR